MDEPQTSICFERRLLIMNKIESVMDLEMILHQFGIDAGGAAIIPIHQGLINHTWKIETALKAFILQQVNHTVFERPLDVADNISLVAAYLSRHSPGYVFPAPVKTIHGENLFKSAAGQYYRVFPFIGGSHTINSVQTPEQAFEAAKQFGKFTAVLRDFDTSQLKTTIPSFHDLEMRYQQFLEALDNGNEERKKESAEIIECLQNWSHIVETFKQLKSDPDFKVRVTHHDTKINNVLFDASDKAICVIDLDTLMPGYFISDVGDMMRTYLSEATEEQDPGEVRVRLDMYEAIVTGYLKEMKDDLTVKEKENFFYAGEFMIYMQALRFLTDHLNNDRYYGAAWPGQNFKRALNQVTLLQQFLALKEMVQSQMPDAAHYL